MQWAMRKTSDKINKINDNPLGKVDFIFLSIILFLFFALCMYTDLIDTYLHSMGVIDAIFDGNFFEAYDYATKLGLEWRDNANWAIYPFPIYLIMGLWNLPVWCLHKFFAVSYFHPLCLLWAKGLLLPFSIGSLYFFNGILKDFRIGIEKRRLAIFLFCSSLWFVLPVFAVAQYDILGVFFILWGFREYLKNEKVTFKTVLIFSLAVMMKMFAVFLAVPLIFLKEKRIFSSLAKIVLMFLPTGLCSVLFSGSYAYAEGTYWFNNLMIDRLFGTVWQGGNSSFPVFVVLWIGICIYAYWLKVAETEQIFKYAVWLGCAVWLSFFCFVHIHPYWVVLGVPFMVLLIIQNPQNSKINLILETFVCGFSSLFYIVTFNWVYLCNSNMNYLLFNLFGIPLSEERRFADYWNALIGEKWLAVVYAGFIACSAAILLINRPDKSHRAEDETIKVDHGMLYLRILILAGYILLDILLFLWR